MKTAKYYKIISVKGMTHSIASLTEVKETVCSKWSSLCPLSCKENKAEQNSVIHPPTKTSSYTTLLSFQYKPGKYSN